MRSISRCFFLLIGTLLFPVGGPIAADPGPADAVKMFKALQAQYQSDLEQFWKASEKAADDEQEKLLETQYPGNTMAAEFFKLEQECRGTLVGLSCLQQLVSQGGGVSRSNQPVSTGKRDAMVILRDHYADHPEIDRLLNWVNSGSYYGDEAASLLERLTESPHRRVRGSALYYLAEHMKLRATVPQAHRNLRELMTEADADTPLDRFLDKIEPYYREIDVEASRKRAIELVEQVLSEYPEIKLPPGTPYGPILIEEDRSVLEKSLQSPLSSLQKMSEQLKFELTHLAIGCKAPDIAVPDAFGNPLRLYDHHGSAVVLFFSFKWCGPCEAMYPENRTLIEGMKGRPFAFLGVMGDEKVDTVHESVSSGTITWPVWWTGPNRELADKWNISGWPGIFVLDHTGTIRYKGLRGEHLKRAVEKLVAEAEAAKSAAK